MAFASTVTDSTVMGNVRKIWGTFTNATGDSGGAITTNLSYILAFGINFTSHAGVTEPKCTVSAGTLTIVVDDDCDGRWWAEGYGGG